MLVTLHGQFYEWYWARRIELATLYTICTVLWTRAVMVICTCAHDLWHFNVVLCGPSLSLCCFWPSFLDSLGTVGRRPHHRHILCYIYIYIRINEFDFKNQIANTFYVTMSTSRSCQKGKNSLKWHSQLHAVVRWMLIATCWFNWKKDSRLPRDMSLENETSLVHPN